MTYSLFRQTHCVVQVSGSGSHIRLVEVRKFRVSQAHGFFKIMGLDSFRYFLRVQDCLYKGFPSDLVFVDGNERSWGLWGGV